MTASQLIQACHHAGSDNVGGWTLGGDDSFIKITIMDRAYLQRLGKMNTIALPADGMPNTGLIGLLTNGTGADIDTT